MKDFVCAWVSVILCWLKNEGQWSGLPTRQKQELKEKEGQREKKIRGDGYE